MPHETIRTSAIFIATRGRTHVFRTLSEVPPRLRRKLLRSTGSPNAATVVIADRRGAEELLHLKLAQPGLRKQPRRRAATFCWAGRHWVELSLVCTLALLIWVLVSIRP